MIKRLLFVVLMVLLFPFVCISAFIDVLIIMPIKGVIWVIADKDWEDGFSLMEYIGAIPEKILKIN